MMKRMLAVCVFLLFIGSTTPRGITRTKLAKPAKEANIEASIGQLAEAVQRIEAKAQTNNQSRP
jgi:hypothetical protein